jgi:hypothetical protein
MTDAEFAERGLAALAGTSVELLRQLTERQAPVSPARAGWPAR